jgi:hypothetical protein
MLWFWFKSLIDFISPIAAGPPAEDINIFIKKESLNGHHQN